MVIFPAQTVRKISSSSIFETGVGKTTPVKLKSSVGLITALSPGFFFAWSWKDGSTKRGILYFSVCAGLLPREIPNTGSDWSSVCVRDRSSLHDNGSIDKEIAEAAFFGLPFNQLQKHDKQLVSFLEKDEQQAEKLACPLNVTDQNKELNHHQGTWALYVTLTQCTPTQQVRKSLKMIIAENSNPELRRNLEQKVSWTLHSLQTMNMAEMMEGNLVAMAMYLPAIDDLTKKNFTQIYFVIWENFFLKVCVSCCYFFCCYFVIVQYSRSPMEKH